MVELGTRSWSAGVIWNSVFAMTAIDVLVIATVAIVAITVFRLGAYRVTGYSGRGNALILAGLSVIALFYLADLLTMHLMPVFVTAAEAMAAMTALHLEAHWIISAVSLPLICAGFLLELLSRRYAAAEMQASESRYRSIVQGQTEFIVRWQPGGIRTWVNEPYCRVFGISQQEAIGTSFYSLISDADIIRVQQELQELSPASPTRTGTHEVMLPGGATAWQEWTDRALFDSNGDLIEIQSIGRDITDRVITEHALEESEARFRGFVENTYEWVWQTDAAGCCTYSNGQSARILGYEPEEIIERSLPNLVHPEDRDETVAQLMNATDEHDDPAGWLARFIHRDGSVRYLESYADPVLDERGKLIGHRGIGRDSTFQTLLDLLSEDLIGCTAEEVDGKIRLSLERIGRSYNLDRISFWWFDESTARRSHEWSRDALGGPRTQLVTNLHVPVGFAALTERRAYKVEDVSQLPPDSPDRRFLETQNVKATMALPLFEEDQTVGAAVCSTVRMPRTWPADIENQLQRLAERVAAAHMQAEATLSVVRRERDLARAEELAHVGSYTFYRSDDAKDFPKGWRAHFSREFCALLETPPEEAAYELLLSRIHKDDRSDFAKRIDSLLDGGRPISQHYRVVNPSGVVIHFAGRTEVELDTDGSITRIVGSIRDITEQVEREQELVRALDENEKLRNRLVEENVQLREEIRSITEFEQIIGDSPALRASLQLAAKAAPTDAAVLILGETGTGKELVARAIHDLSSRRDKRLVSVNCTALPANLVESELFGHEKGAFTGAASRRPGRFESAEGGTLFLDEIGDLPIDLQAKLLRVLEDGGYERLGGNTTLHADVRLIAATNRNLEAAVRAGEFRADLYYRISTVPIELPALRERKEDIPNLAHHFVAKHSARLGKSVNAISTRMLEYLQNRDWPGNIRELEHFIERTLISATGQVLTLDEQSVNQAKQQPITANKPVALRSVERDHILQVLEETHWVIDGGKGAAAALGLAPSTLRSKMKRLGIARRA